MKIELKATRTPIPTTKTLCSHGKRELFAYKCTSHSPNQL